MNGHYEVSMKFAVQTVKAPQHVMTFTVKPEDAAMFEQHLKDQGYEIAEKPTDEA